MKLQIGLSISLTVLTCAILAHAETKPQFERKTKAADISVTIEPVLRKHPGLFDDLMAEGKRRAERLQAEAAKEFRARPDFCTDGRGWYFEGNYVLRSLETSRISGHGVNVIRLASKVISASVRASSGIATTPGRM